MTISPTIDIIWMGSVATSTGAQQVRANSKLISDEAKCLQPQPMLVGADYSLRTKIECSAAGWLSGELSGRSKVLLQSLVRLRTVSSSLMETDIPPPPPPLAVLQTLEDEDEEEDNDEVENDSVTSDRVSHPNNGGEKKQTVPPIHYTDPSSLSRSDLEEGSSIGRDNTDHFPGEKFESKDEERKMNGEKVTRKGKSSKLRRNSSGILQSLLKAFYFS